MRKIIFSLLFALALVSCGDNFDGAFKTLSTEDTDINGDHFWYFDVVGSKVPLRLVPSEDGKSLTPEIDVVLKINDEMDFTEDAIYECANMHLSIGYDTTFFVGFEDLNLKDESRKELAEKLKAGKTGKITLTFATTEPVEAKIAEEIATLACQLNSINGVSFDTRKVSSDDLFAAIFPDSEWDEVFDELEEMIEKTVELYDEAKDSRSDSDIDKLDEQAEKVELMLVKIGAARGQEKAYNRTSTMNAIDEYLELR